MPAAISWRTLLTRSCLMGAPSFLRLATALGCDFHFLPVRETGPLIVDGPCLNMIHVLSLGILRKDGSEFPRRYYNLWHRSANPNAGPDKKRNFGHFADGFQAAFVEPFSEPCCSNAQHLNSNILIVSKMLKDEKKYSKFTSGKLGV